MDTATGVSIELQRQITQQQELLNNVLSKLEEDGIQGVAGARQLIKPSHQSLRQRSVASFKKKWLHFLQLYMKWLQVMKWVI